MPNDWPIYLMVFGSLLMIMHRLDRLGKQPEAVFANAASSSQSAPSGARFDARSRRVQVYETCSQGPHPVPPSKRLATTPFLRTERRGI